MENSSILLDINPKGMGSLRIRSGWVRGIEKGKKWMTNTENPIHESTLELFTEFFLGSLGRPKSVLNLTQNPNKIQTTPKKTGKVFP